MNWPQVEYENALLEFNGDKTEAILQRIISNPIHVYKLIGETEKFASEVYNPLIEQSNLTGMLYIKEFLEYQLVA